MSDKVSKLEKKVVEKEIEYSECFEDVVDSVSCEIEGLITEKKATWNELDTVVDTLRNSLLFCDEKDNSAFYFMAPCMTDESKKIMLYWLVVISEHMLYHFESFRKGRILSAEDLNVLTKHIVFKEII